MECPEENVVVDFVRGEVDDELRVAIERHLDGCGACLQVVGELARIFQLPVEADAGTYGGGQTLVETSPMTGKTRRDDVFVAGLHEGSKLGRYVVLSRVGAGGMGVVFAAYDPELDRKVAIKLMRSAPGGSGPKELADQRARLLREAQAMAKLSHANVITVHDVGTIDGQVFVAMEFIDGTTLSGWLRERPRKWREVMTVVLAAGRGLAAAHAAGLVHRDFKPDNVLIGKDGRVLVTDFGLARPAAGRTDAFATVGSSSGPKVLGLALTQTGALVGTPAYMAPEQLAGERSDALADQFSFCIAAYEGLYGERPFAGRVLSELIANVTDGAVRPATAKSAVPRWLRRALLRGLAVAREDRYPSMDALLQALAHDPWRRWRQAAIIGVPAVVVGAATLAYQQHEQPRAAAYCQDVREKLSAVWDDDRREAVRQRFEAAGTSWATDGYEHLARKLDPYAEQWLAMQTQACRDEVEGARPQAVLALQMTCLERRRDALAALGELLAAGDTSTLERAIDAADSLPALDVCGDLERLMAREGSLDATVEPETRRSIDAALARAKVLIDASRVAEARTEAVALVERTKAAGYARGEAFARHLVAVAYDLGGETESAERSYHEALSASLASGDAEVVVRASIGLLWVSSQASRPIIEADRWYAHGKGALERMGGDPELGAELERALAVAYLQHGQLAPAEQHARASVKIREDNFGVDHASLGLPLGTLGEVLAAQDRMEPARETFERARALIEREYGELHPNAAAANDNLGALLAESGDLEGALAPMRRGLAIREAALGMDHPTNAASHHNLAAALRELGRFDEARVHAMRELAIARTAFGEHNPEYASALGNLALCDAEAEQHEAAVAGFRQARDIVLASLGDGHPQLAFYSGGVAAELLALGRASEAIPFAEEALAVRLAALGKDHFKVGTSERMLADVLLAADRPDDAIRHAENAIAILTGKVGDNSMLGRSQFALARALWDSTQHRDRERAKQLARDALATVKTRTPIDADDVDTIGGWIEAHP